MHITWLLDRLTSWQGEGVQVIDANIVPGHDLSGGLVVPVCVPFDPSGGSLRNRSCGCEYQRGAGLLQSQCQLLQIAGILVDRDLLPAFGHGDQLTARIGIFQVVKAVVEVDHIPLGLAQPFVEFRQSVRRVLGVARIVKDVGLLG